MSGSACVTRVTAGRQRTRRRRVREAPHSPLPRWHGDDESHPLLLRARSRRFLHGGLGFHA
jgi:hypothetical protein